VVDEDEEEYVADDDDEDLVEKDEDEDEPRAAKGRKTALKRAHVQVGSIFAACAVSVKHEISEEERQRIKRDERKARELAAQVGAWVWGARGAWAPARCRANCSGTLLLPTTKAGTGNTGSLGGCNAASAPVQVSHDHMLFSVGPSSPQEAFSAPSLRRSTVRKSAEAKEEREWRNMVVRFDRNSRASYFLAVPLSVPCLSHAVA
jgi:hypothetical protein